MVDDSMRDIASKGGKARAESLTAEQRRAIAKEAASARWATPRETHAGALRFGNVEIPCSVLDNGTRVLSTQGITRAFGGKTQGTAKRKTETRQLPAFMASERLKPFISMELASRVTNPITYIPKRGGLGKGYEATLLPEIATLFVKASRHKALQKNQEKYVQAAQVILEGLATVGIIALIDEATGYQNDRAKDELVRILEAYISKALLPWTRRFPPEFFGEIRRLYGWPPREENHQGPRFMGKLIKQLVYEQLPPGVLEELETKNPVLPKGYRRYKHHQFLTADIGHPHLGNQVATVMGLMRASETRQEFYRLFERAFPKRAADTNVLIVTKQMKLPLGPGFED